MGMTALELRKRRIDELYAWAKEKKASKEQIEAEAIRRFGLSKRMAKEYGWVISTTLK